MWLGQQAYGDAPTTQLIIRLLLLYKRLEAVFSRCEDVAKKKDIYKRQFSMDYSERRSYARGVYPTCTRPNYSAKEITPALRS